jgi:hypothetical protein
MLGIRKMMLRGRETRDSEEMIEDEAIRNDKVRLDQELPQEKLASQPTERRRIQEESNYPGKRKGDEPTHTRLPMFPPRNDHGQNDRYYYEPYGTPSDPRDKLEENVQQHEDELETSKLEQKDQRVKKHSYPGSYGPPR